MIGLSLALARVRARLCAPQALTVLVNAPPTSGFLTVEPAAGVVLQTAFSFECAGWVDDATDLPLLYSFFFEIYGADGTEYQLVAKTPTTSWYSVPSAP